MRIHKLDQAQDNLMFLISVAEASNGINRWHLHLIDLYALVDIARTRQLTRRELVHMTRLVQECVEMPIYTTRQAAAWLGMSQGGMIRTLKGHKPGHDRLILHADLVRYNAEQRHWPLGDNLLPDELAYDEPSTIAALGNVQ